MDTREWSNDLPCTVSPDNPTLGFDLRYQVNYEISIPLRALAGEGNWLTIIFRVTHEDRPDEPVYFTQRLSVPEIDEGARGDASLFGKFNIGEGKYKVDWLMRDQDQRACTSFWDFTAALPDRDRQIELVMAPGEIAAHELEQFKEEPPSIRNHTDKQLHLKVLVNFAPQDPRASTLQPFDTAGLVSVLRRISREPRIGKFSLVAFNLHEQRIINEQNSVDRIDFPALGNSLKTLKLGTTDLERLGEKHGETRFLTELILRELSTEDVPDALIITGPKARLGEGISQEELRELRSIDYPIYYMNYNIDPRGNPWRDTISYAVRFLKGYEYAINQPRDLWYAVKEIVSRAAKIKESQQIAEASE